MPSSSSSLSLPLLSLSLSLPLSPTPFVLSFIRTPHSLCSVASPLPSTLPFSRAFLSLSQDRERRKKGERITLGSPHVQKKTTSQGGREDLHLRGEHRQQEPRRRPRPRPRSRPRPSPSPSPPSWSSTGRNRDGDCHARTADVDGEAGQLQAAGLSVGHDGGQFR